MTIRLHSPSRRSCGLILSLLLACGSFAGLQPSTAQAAERGGLVRIVSVGEPQLLNPVFDTSPPAEEIYRLIYSGLIRENARGELEPDLLEVVPTAGNGLIKMTDDGGMSVTYKLRPGLKWQDGHPLTADDVLFTWQVNTDPKVKYPPTPGYEQLSSVEIVNPQTVLAHFHRPYGDYYKLFQTVMPRHSFQNRAWSFAPDHPYNRHPVGSGPFALVAWTRGETAILDANPLYHHGRPHLDQVRYVFKADNYRAIKDALNWTSDAEAMRGLPLASYDYLKERPELDLHVVPDGQIEYLQFNLGDPILADLRVRRALAFATDRRKISDLLLGLAEPAYTDQLQDSWKYNAETEQFYPPSLNQAAANLSLAGWKQQTDKADSLRSRDGKPLSLELTIEAGNKSHQQVARYLQEAWKQAGVDLKVKTVSPQVLRQEVLPTGAYQLTMGTWTQQPDETPYRRWHSTQTPPMGMNYGHFSDYQVDQLTRSLQETVSLSQQKKLYRELSNVIASQLPVLPLYYGAELEANRKNLHNYAPNAHMGTTWNSFSWWIDP